VTDLENKELRKHGNALFRQKFNSAIKRFAMTHTKLSRQDELLSMMKYKTVTSGLKLTNSCVNVLLAFCQVV
jgi:hypothetical protein